MVEQLLDEKRQNFSKKPYSLQAVSFTLPKNFH